MRNLRERVRIASNGDRGMTLIEVMVAMFVFAILSTMVLSSLLQIITQNRHSQAEHVAANLAASEIELAHAADDLFQLLDESRSVVVDGVRFRVQREAEWVNASAEDVTCSAGGGTLSYKRVNVTVTWEGMRASAQPVRADTVINPDDRINDPSRGTVIVWVFDSLGEPVSSATVGLAATAGGGPVDPVTTDAQGCAFVLRVPPGTYDVTVQKPDYLGLLEKTARKSNVSVQAGTATPVDLRYDRAAVLDITFAAGSLAKMPSTTPSLTLVSTHGLRTVDFTTNSPRQSVPVHPRVSYRAFAGVYRASDGKTCQAVDPLAWQSDPALSDPVNPEAGEMSAEPGATAAFQVSMGLFQISSDVSSVRAVRTFSQPGVPSCNIAVTYDFSGLRRGSTIALPYGSWRITSGSRYTTPVPGNVVGGNAAVGDVTLAPLAVSP